MALGIGANTSIFSLVDTVLLPPLPCTNRRGSSQLYGTIAQRRRFHAPIVSELPGLPRPQHRPSQDCSPIAFVVSSLSHNGKNERVWGYLVSGNYFDVLGVKPALGRAFLPEEDQTPGFASGRRPELRLLGTTLRLRPRNRRPDGAVQWPRRSLSSASRRKASSAPRSRMTPEFWTPMMMANEIEPGTHLARAPRRATIFSSSAGSNRA